MAQIGYCCISLSPEGEHVPTLRNAAMTVTHVGKLGPKERHAYVARAVKQNLDALAAVVEHLAAQPPHLRMFRVTSGLLPLYTHESVRSIYTGRRFAQAVADQLAAIGSRARAAGVRLSQHPGQFTVLNSAQEHVRVASIAEFEYHARIGEWLGYRGGNNLHGRATGRDDWAINVHGGSWQGDWVTSTAGWRWSWPRLSAAARQMITLENDENSWGGAEIVRLCTALDIRTVFDVHHHWVRSGEWLGPNSELAQAVKRTWHGRVPKLHVSCPQPEFILPMLSGRPWLDSPEQALDDLHGYEPLPIAAPGIPRNHLRAHAQYIYHPAMIKYLHTWGNAGWSIMSEAKAKNLASQALYANLQWAVLCHRSDLLAGVFDKRVVLN